jgi:tetratricopeptide (TPR) repeat protein
MKWLRCTAVALILAAGASAAQAVDNEQSADAPDLGAVRAKIKVRDFSGAVGELNAMIDKGIQHPDLYSLLGYSLRKSGDQKTAMTFYTKALEFNPEHKGALEYQGELFVEMGDLTGALSNATKLAKLCPQGCEEREDLDQAIRTAQPK